MTLAYIRNNKTLVICVAALIVFVIFALVSFAQLEALKKDSAGFESQIAALTERTADYEKMMELNEELVAKNEELTSSNDELTDKNDRLSANIESHRFGKEELYAAIDELERLNGDLLKKFDGLSKPD